MDVALLERMRARVRQVRRIAAMAHDPEMIEALLKMAEEGEADADRLEAELKSAPPANIPPQPTR